MIIPSALIFILLALLLIGAGVQFIPDISQRAKNWTTFVCFIIAACVLLYHGGVFRVD